MNSDFKACMGLGLLCLTMNLIALPSSADEVIYRTNETRVSPTEMIISPSASVTTTTSTVETAPLMAPDETVYRRTVILGDRPASKTSSSAIISSSLDNRPNYGERIHLLRQQLDKGTNAGWINSERAVQLKDRLNDLAGQEVTVRRAGYLKVDCDSLEKALTGFNIDLSHSMEGHTN